MIINIGFNVLYFFPVNPVHTKSPELKKH